MAGNTEVCELEQALNLNPFIPEPGPVNLSRERENFLVWARENIPINTPTIDASGEVYTPLPDDWASILYPFFTSELYTHSLDTTLQGSEEDSDGGSDVVDQLSFFHLDGETFLYLYQSFLENPYLF